MVKVRNLAWRLAIVRWKTGEKQGSYDEKKGSDRAGYGSKNGLVGEHGVCKSLCVRSLRHGFAHDLAPVEQCSDVYLLDALDD